MLFKNSNYSPLKKAYFPEPIDTTICKICVSTKKDRNDKIRSLFIEKITTLSPVISYRLRSPELHLDSTISM